MVCLGMEVLCETNGAVIFQCNEDHTRLADVKSGIQSSITLFTPGVLDRLTGEHWDTGSAGAPNSTARQSLPEF